MKKIVTYALLITVSVISVILVSKWDELASDDQQPKSMTTEKPILEVKQTSENSDSTTSTISGKETSAGTAEPLRCVSKQESLDFEDSGKSHEVRAWLSDLGVFIPNYFDESKEQYLDTHPYSGYSMETIEALVKQNDPLAIHTYGLVHRWRSFNQALPDRLIQVFDDNSFSIDRKKTFSSEHFDQSNELLFKAAALGRTEALADISFNYFYLELYLKATKSSNDDLKSNVRINKVVYSKLRQKLIPVLPDLFPNKLPNQDRLEFEDRLSEKLIQFRSLQTTLGTELPTVTDAVRAFFRLQLLPTCTE